MIDAQFKRVWIEDGRTLQAEGDLGGRYGIWPLAWIGMEVLDEGQKKRTIGPRDLEEMLVKLEKVVVK